MKGHPAAWLALLGLVAAAVLLAPDVGPVPATTTDAADVAAIETTQAAVAPGESRGEVVPPAAEARTEHGLDFDGCVERLVALGVALWEAVESGERARTRSIDAEAESLLVTLRNVVAVPEEHALYRLGGLPPDDDGRETEVRRKVLCRIVADGLLARWERSRSEGARLAVDRLTGGALALVAQDERLARAVGLGLLVDRPYLGAAHEEAVLELVERSAAEPFLREVSTRLLTTLWANLEASGERAAGAVAQLALLFKDDANRARELAALEFLLAADGGRYRGLVVQQVVARGDADLARHVGMVAARSLPVGDALGVLEAVVDVGRDRMVAAFMTLGARDGGALAGAYERKLADNVHPRLRAELVTGVGFERTPAGIETAKTAFAHDPDLGVRARAMFVLSAAGDPDLAERTLMAALDDPEFAADSGRVGKVVIALGNLARAGAVNAVARIGARLRTHPNLNPGSRAQLDDLLAQHVPPGGG